MNALSSASATSSSYPGNKPPYTPNVAVMSRWSETFLQHSWVDTLCNGQRSVRVPEVVYAHRCAD